MATKKTKEPTAGAALLTINPLPMEVLEIPITGVTPLIVNRFGPKIREEIRRIEAGGKKIKMPRDPLAEYEDAFYRIKGSDLDGEFGFPLTAFKSCTVSACRFYDRSVSMQAVKQYLWFEPEYYDEDGVALVPLQYDDNSPRMREDPVRVRNGGTTLRYRPEFTGWSTTVRVRYVMSSINMDSVLELMNAGGLNVGVGEWRPEKGTGGNSGTNGCWQVDHEQGISIHPFVAGRV